MYVGTVVAAVALAKAVVVHAVLLLLLLLTSVRQPDDGEAPLNGTAGFRKHTLNHRFPQINNQQPLVAEEDKLRQD